VPAIQVVDIPIVVSIIELEKQLALGIVIQAAHF